MNKDTNNAQHPDRQKAIRILEFMEKRIDEAKDMGGELETNLGELFEDESWYNLEDEVTRIITLKN